MASRRYNVLIDGDTVLKNVSYAEATKAFDHMMFMILRFREIAKRDSFEYTEPSVIIALA